MTRPAGFTLVEIIVAIVVLGIVSVSFGVFILPAITAHQDMQRRAALVDAAESALRRMTRDIRISLPNSVRTTNVIAGGTGFAIEMIPTADGARYCTAGTADCDIAGANILSIGSADSVFDVLGCFRNAAFIAASGTNAYRLVVDNTESVGVLLNGIYVATGASAVINPVGNVTLSIFPGTGATPTVCGSASATANSFNRHRITLAAAHTFPTASPRQRVFVIEDAAVPVTYICNATAGTLTRYAGYKDGVAYSTSSQPTSPAAAPLSATTGRLVAANISACSATTDEVTVQSSAVVTLTLGLSNAGNIVELVKQVQLDNSQ